MTPFMIAGLIPVALLVVHGVFTAVRPRREEQPAHIESGRSHMRTPKEQR